MTDDIHLVNFGKSYKLKPLPPDTPLKTIIELINFMGITLHPSANDSPDIAKFVEDHPELVEEVD